LKPHNTNYIFGWPVRSPHKHAVAASLFHTLSGTSAVESSRVWGTNYL